MYLIQHYDNNLNRTKSLELLIPDKSGKEREFIHIMQLNQTIYLFSSLERKSDNKNVLYVQTIDKKTLVLNSDERILIEQDSKSNYNFIVSVSKDQSKIMIYTVFDTEDKGNRKYAFTLFDGKLNFIWGNKCSIPYKNGLFTESGFKVDNNGDCYILARIYQNKNISEKIKGKPNYSYRLFSFKNKGETINEYPIEIQEKFIPTMEMDLTDKNDIICAGFYSNIDKYSINGSCYFSIDGKSGAILKKNFQRIRFRCYYSKHDRERGC